MFTEAPEVDKSSPQHLTPFKGMFLGHEGFIENYEADNRVHKSKPLFNMCVCVYTHTNIQAPEEEKSSPQHKNPFKDIYIRTRPHTQCLQKTLKPTI